MNVKASTIPTYTYLPIYLSTYLPTYLPIYLPSLITTVSSSWMYVSITQVMFMSASRSERNVSKPKISWNSNEGREGR